jgi:UDPglucose--hexose-1-phosphate uridylyltransferase
MPELRQDPVTGNWVVIATERSKRPSDFQVRPDEKRGGACPFCKGNEKMTPPEIVAFREAGTGRDEPGWWIRVVPNKYPALEMNEEIAVSSNFFTSMSGVGAHEVIIEAPEHETPLEELDLAQIMEIFRAWRDRYQALMARKTIRYVQIFKNEGAVAGASLEHPHSQVIAVPLVPSVIAAELNGANTYFLDRGHCPYCDMIGHESETGKRLISENGRFIAFCPFASRFPFEIMLLPKQHQASFAALDESLVQDFSAIVKESMSRLSASLHRPPYNLMLHTAPAGYEGATYYHWHIEVLPRLAIVAGFEWGTGFYINPTPPETAARYLTEALAPSMA